jgi:hypothetical protein
MRLAIEAYSSWISRQSSFRLHVVGQRVVSSDMAA